MDNKVDVSMPPDMMKSLVRLLPCFITTDIINPLEACQKSKRNSVIRPIKKRLKAKLSSKKKIFK